MKRIQLQISLSAVLFVLLLSACLANQPPPELASYPTSKSAVNMVAPSATRTGGLAGDALPEEIVKSEYDQLVVGETTLEQAEEIIGSAGKAVKTIKTKNGDVITYQWVGHGDLNKNVKINFRDGVLLTIDPEKSNVKGKIS
jgi:hypothetical protein